MSQRTLGSLLDTSRITCGASISSKKKSLQFVAELMENSLDINDDDDDDDEGVDMDIMDALAARERLGCTGMGHGIAIPHGRVDFISDPIGALLILTEPVPFDAPDDLPVDIVFGLLIPEDQNEEHLHILASLARFFNSAENRDSIRNSGNAEEILQTLLQRNIGPAETVASKAPPHHQDNTNHAGNPGAD